MSFNGPAWSVSVEVFLYALFFAWCYRMPRRTWMLAVAAVAGRFVVFHRYFPLAQGIWSFFLGGVIANWYTKSARLPGRARRDYQIFAWTFSLWALTGASAYLGGVSAVETLIARYVPGVTVPAIALLQRLVNNWPSAVLFPATIVTTLLLDRRLGRRLQPLAMLGEISYSSYLLHFPLQLAVVLIATRMGVSRTHFYSPLFFASFLIVLIGLSLLSYRRYERPLQDWARRRFLS